MNDISNVILIIVCARDADIGALPGAWLSEYRRANMARLKNARDKALSACAELALILCLSARDERFKPPVEYAADSNGRPGFIAPGMGWLSISHSGDYAACAHAYMPVGVDIERRDRAFEKLAGRILSPGEARAEPGASELARIWCAKESYLKLTGEGISGGMSNLTLTDGRIHDARGEREALIYRRAFENYECAICAREAFELDMRAYTFARALARAQEII